VNVLIDSHAFIWWLADNRRLSQGAKAAISENDPYVSVVSAYEIGLKAFSGRWDEAVQVAETFGEACERNGIGILPISLDHAIKAAAFGVDHGDPFDRLLAAQSLIEDFTLVTVDRAFGLFGCKTIW
jgi:PIN domain nuclease of toxin-antitoxin system